MAEGFELVRTIRQHLRRGAALLEQGNIEEALQEADSALALDPQSLPAQTLRDRIQIAKVSAHAQAARTDSARSFVPYGVNAASWRGFEQRITERRFRALLDTINTSIVAGDAIAARVALEEARELRPDAPELADFQARVAAVPVALPVADAAPPSRIWVRAIGAAAMFLVGVSLLLGLEWMRPGDTREAVPIAAPPTPDTTPAQDVRPVEKPDLAPVPVALNDEDSVPAIETPPEPLRPRATTGDTQPPIVTRPVEFRQAARAAGETVPSPVERTVDRRVIEEPALRPAGEVPDDYVDSGRSPVAARAADRPVMASARAESAPVIETRDRSATVAASVVPAAAIPGVEQQKGVEEVLRRYARAYGALDASAARAVWPSVDEKALARAFQNLASQNVSFDDCDIDIRGAVANASCRGQASYVGKVGNREPKTESRTWRFELRREGDAWMIEGVDARRQSAAAYRP